MNRNFDIAVVGAGFSGLMVVANLMRRAPKRTRIFWTDPGIGWGHGLAYSTHEECHLLNVRADRMGAFADGIDDFWRWLQKTHRGRFQAQDFVPRRIYGAYLADIRDRFSAVPMQTTKVKGAKIQGGRWVLKTGGEEIDAAHLVLATGNPPIAALGWPRTEIFVDDFWAWRFEGQTAGRCAADDLVVIAGAGLTAADAILSLLSDGYRGRILCVSPHGHMPAVHEPVAGYDGKNDLLAGLRSRPTALNYLRQLRLHTGAAPWRDVIDSLRQATPDLWRRLDEREKARFMRHLWSRWNVHRHRMAPSIAQTIAGSGRVEIMAGRIVAAEDDGGLTIRPRVGGPDRRVKAIRVLNCTGPSYRRMVSENPLLRNLRQQELVTPGPLGLGIATPDAANFHAIGTLLLGERFETTAVPDLRGQAAEIAQTILKALGE